MNKLLLVIFFLFSLFSHAFSTVQAEEIKNTLNTTIKNTISLPQMGIDSGILLTSRQLQGGSNFTLPKNEVATKATFNLNIKAISIKSNEHITLSLKINNQPLADIPLKLENDQSVSYQIEIPPLSISSYNHVNFKINTETEYLCLSENVDDFAFLIQPTSKINFETKQLSFTSDLKQFPFPFFDDKKMSNTEVTFAFPKNLSEAQISAATLISSWFGVKAAYRDLSFSVLTNSLPEKNGILIGASEEVIGSIKLPKTDRPMIKLIENPKDPEYKLLLLIGKNKQELIATSWRLIQGDFTSGTLEYIVSPQSIPNRQPYDAPNWISTKNPVKLKELLRKDQSMKVNGTSHEALQVNFRAAPDLFLWQGQTIPLHLEYRFPSENWIDTDKSFLNLTFNNKFLEDLSLNKKGGLNYLWHLLGGDIRQESANVPIQPYMIYGDNQLSLYFNVEAQKNTPCQAITNSNIKSYIDENSWLDLTKTKHLSVLPNLSYFIGASFPFSRIADYAETSILLPNNPTPSEISTILNLAARSGNSTGVPLNQNTVYFGLPTHSKEQEKLASTDILVASSVKQAQFNQSILFTSPFKTNGTSINTRKLKTSELIANWLQGEWDINRLEADRYLTSKEAWRGFISYQSPWNKKRVLIWATGSDDQQLIRLHSDLTSKNINASIRGDMAIITGESSVKSFRVAPQFVISELPWYLMIIWYASKHSIMLALSGLLTCLIIGLIVYKKLNRLASKRLASQPKKHG